MRADDWEPLAEPVAREVGRLNDANLTNAVTALVTSLLSRGGEGEHPPPIPAQTALRQLHQVGALFLVDRPGRYRVNDVEVARAGEIVFHAPPWRQVAPRMRRFFAGLPAVWASGDPLDVAAHALWSITRIHPFRDGNGRAASAFAYACLCLKLGAPLPGRPTVFEQIMDDRIACETALRAVDETASASGARADLSALKAHLDALLLRQVQSARDAAVSPDFV